MKKQVKQAPSGGFSLQDILFVLFRHKWKIMICTLIGLGAAAAVYRTQKPLYQSTAKLLVKYVIERSQVDPFRSQIDPGGRATIHVIDTEKELLTSGDLAIKVAEQIGPERLLPAAGENATANSAAGVVLGGLKVSAKQGGNVLRVSYSHSDPVLAVEILDQVIQNYYVRHLEIHRSTGSFNYVAKRCELARSKLHQAQEELTKVLLEAGIMDLATTRTKLESKRTSVTENLLQAKAELVEQGTRVEALGTALGAAPAAKPVEGDGLPPLGEEGGDDPGKALMRDSALARTEYQALAERLDFLRERRMQMLAKFTPGHPSVKSIERQIETVKGDGLKLIEKHPELVGYRAADGSTGNLDVEKAQLLALTAKVGALQEQSDAVDAEVQAFSRTAMKIADLERDKMLADRNYTDLQASLDEAQVDEQLDPSKMPNIEPIQQPSQPIKVFDEVIEKVILGLAVGGLGLGLAIAFLIEMVIDRRVKRPTEISARLQLPLMMSIPYFRVRDRGAALLSCDDDGVVDEGGGDLVLPPVRQGDRALARRGRSGHFVLPYAKAIRDRIIFNFEVNNVLHRPKLVALAGLSDDAGTSTIAAGVAKAFAEVEGMKVLLVDLNPKVPDKPALPNGRATDSLQRALSLSEGSEFREGSDNLFYVRAQTQANGNGAPGLAPMQLYGLIPKLQASDFDYVIFDMPSIDQTSPTLAMAGFMDKVLMILDAENTSREELTWGYEELSRGNADVSCVFNKARSHAPRWVEGGV